MIKTVLRRELFDLKNQRVRDYIRIKEIERILEPIQGKEIRS